MLQAFFCLVWIRPHVVFSKGGFVSVPVSLAASALRIPVVTHESDLTPGLANKIIMKFATQVLYSFPQSQKHLPRKALQVNLPVRKELFSGSKEKALDFCFFAKEDSRPVILVMGGSLGSLKINSLVKESLDDLLMHYRVIHLTGKGKKLAYAKKGSYFQMEFAKEELCDFLALADLVISRSGANSIFEYLALAKPMILIPLVEGSRGDQVDNAKCFVENSWAESLDEKSATVKDLLLLVDQVLADTALEKRLQEQKNKALEQTDKIIEILESSKKTLIKS